ncbi:hypothetical protein B0J11DRAFT_602078 [Dendryphion nanum]|uniref:Uncharacterized protein n=1 Tax=Dendryphion nanum TaxID=256645 RepID=A0A9P9I5T6_9PLEO|nr:hypothetical protein B0J11DRAFT_602078 [Dendryphion nanum]
MSEKHDKQRELSFWKTHHKGIKTHLPTAATVSTGHCASLRVDLVPAEPPLRPWQGQAKICKQATQYDTFIERSNSHLATAQQHESDDGAQTPFHGHNKYTIYRNRWVVWSAHRQPTMFATSHFDEPSTERHHLSYESPHRHPACYYRCHTILQINRQPRPLSPPLCRRGGVPSTHSTRSEEIRARALMLSRLDGTPQRSICLAELRHDEMLLPLRSAAGHTTKHGHIGTYCNTRQSASTNLDTMIEARQRVGKGTAGYTAGVVKWGLLIRSAKYRLSAKPSLPGITADIAAETE